MSPSRDRQRCFTRAELPLKAKPYRSRASTQTTKSVSDRARRPGTRSPSRIPDEFRGRPEVASPPFAGACIRTGAVLTPPVEDQLLRDAAPSHNTTPVMSDDVGLRGPGVVGGSDLGLRAATAMRPQDRSVTER